MPSDIVLLTSDSSATDATSYVTASITPPANSLIIVVVANGRTAATTIPTVDGNGISYFGFRGANALGDDGNFFRISAFRGMSASPTTGTITIDFGATTHQTCAWSVWAVTNVNTGGSNGSAAIVQHNANSGDTTGANEIVTVTLAAFADAANATFGAFCTIGNGSALGLGSGFFQIHADVISGDVLQQRMETEWRNDNDTTVTMEVATTGSSWLGLAWETDFEDQSASGGGKRFNREFAKPINAEFN